jgi:uroporphyrinogen-III decarboxylase
LRYVWSDSTLVQDEFLISDYTIQADAVEYWLRNRKFAFDASLWKKWAKRLSVGEVMCAGELVSPLKLLHLIMGPEQTVFFLNDEPDQAALWMQMHHRQQIEVLEQMLSNGVGSVMSMDNLDTMFHSPHYVEKFSAPFYEEASVLCHKFGATFWIHACGRQFDNLPIISSLGVDGLEGLAYPPSGDVTLLQALEATGGNFLITGGIGAQEFNHRHTKSDVFDYVEKLFGDVRSFGNRFIFSASCNTPISARWDQIVWFRDAWRIFSTTTKR